MALPFLGSSGIRPILFTRPRTTGSATPFRRSPAQWPAPRPRKHIVAISIASFHKREACPFLRACRHCYFICSKEILWKFCGEFLIDFYASFHPESALFRPGPAEAGSIFGFSCAAYPSTPPRKPLISQPPVRRWAIWKWRGAKLYAPPFGAALGNPEIAGRQTVRATFRCGAGQSGNSGTPNCTRHLSVRRWATWKWRDAKSYAPQRKMPSFRIGNF
jgi:hypothetical protein